MTAQSYAYEITNADFTEEELSLIGNKGRPSTDSDVNQPLVGSRTFRAVFLPETFEGDPRLTVAATTQEEWRTFLSSETYTRPKTAQEIADEEQAMIQSLESRLDRAVNAARGAVAKPLTFQDSAYKRKYAEATAWYGTGDAPPLVKAYAASQGITPAVAKATIEVKYGIFYAALDATEIGREYGKKAAKEFDTETLNTIVGLFSDLQTAAENNDAAGLVAAVTQLNALNV